MRRASSSEPVELVRDVVEPRLALDQLERARLVVARQHARLALGEPELEPPALGRLRDVGDAQADVVQAPDHRLTRTGRRLIPLKKFDRSRSGGPASSMSDRARQQLLEDDPHLHLRQVRAHAVMDAARPEGHVRVRRAADVEPVGLLEHRLVAVAGDEPGRDLVAGLDLGLGQLGVDGRRAAEVVHGRRPAQHLLGGGLAERRIVAQPLELVRELEQAEQPVRDRVARRLVARRGEQHEVDVELALAQRLERELGDDVVLRLLAPLGGQPPAEGEHVERRRARERQVAVRVVVGDLVLGVLVAEQPVADLDDLAALLLRDAEDLGEHLHRDLRRDLVHEVELALRQRQVEHLARDLADLLLPHADGARREAPRDQPAQLVVARRVHVDHRLARLDLALVEVLERRAADLRREEVDVAVDEADVLVAGDRPEARAVRLGVPVHGVLAAELGERLVRDAVDERVVVGEVDELAGLGHGLRGGGGTRRSPSPRPTRDGARPRTA